MEDSLHLKDEDFKSSETEWALDDGDNLSNTLEITLSQQNLQVISKNEPPSEWPVIPATFMEKLSFYRAYTCTVSKIELLCEQQNKVKRFFWFYIFNVLCKSLPMIYIYLCLSSYSPDNSLFLSKMVPLFYGYNFIFLITGFFGLNLMALNISMYIAYFMFGLIYNRPWNRCRAKKIVTDDYEYSCFNLDEFAQKLNGTNITFTGYFYKTADSEYFDLAQLDYFNHFLNFYLKKTRFSEEGILLIIMSSMWILALCLRNHICKRYIWQILHRAQLLLCAVYILSFFHLLLHYEEKAIHNIKNDLIRNNMLMLADIDLLAESMTAPPVAHIISSRSLGQVKPSLNSALIVISNSVFYIFRAMANYLCKRYCENYVNASIIYWAYGSSSVFYTWPIYFSTVYTGDIMILVFFALNAIVDYCTFLITFQCLIQTFISEWRWIKPLCAAIIIVSAAFAEYFTYSMFIESNYVLWTCISTLSELIIIFWIYPMGRLIDDITFHFGVPPTKLRVWTLTILPIFYFIKACIILAVYTSNSIEGTSISDIELLKTELWTFALHLCFLLIGAAYSFYYYVYKKNRSFLQLFKPAPEWGPKNFKIRQLRKQFDSREYIGSQAPRDLSGHLIEKTEMTSYKLDIRYEGYSRRATFESARE